MKKIISTLVLLFVLSFSIIADDGHTNTGGGKSCPQGQTTCLVSNPNPDSEKTIFSEFFDLLNSILI